MWNETQVSLLQQVINGMGKFKTFQGYETDLFALLELNALCFDHREVISVKLPMAKDDLTKVDAACQFLFREFGVVIHPHDVRVPYKPTPKMDMKLELFASADLRLPDDLRKAWETHERKARRIEKRPVDCLFVTALPTEFRAVARRLDSFAIGTRPDATRGFADAPGGEKPPGWIKGSLTDGKRTASVIVACGSRYGPTAACNAVTKTVEVGKPRYVVVVGIAASLGDKEQLSLGDIGYSTEIIDIHLGKDHSDVTVETEFTTSRAPDQSKIPDHLKEWIKCSDDGKVTGVLTVNDARQLKQAWGRASDRREVGALVKSTRAAADRTDLKTTAITIPRPDSEMQTSKLEEMLKKAESVRKRGRWSDRIHLRRPEPGTSDPRVVPAIVLSGSRVVKQNGMRSYLKETFPAALLLEMEAAGAGEACGQDLVPFVVKSACDWATPEKEASWQPYCADVAAAFAVELALELVGK